MRIIQCDSTAEAIQTVALLVIEKMESHPTAVIGLATGRTMEPVYAEMAKLKTEKSLNLAKNFFFMLDEYFGLPENHPSSFKYYIEKHFLNPLQISASQIAVPPVHVRDGATHYEESIKQSGGVDLQLLGIGRNGHVGFNEPGSEKNSRTRLVRLTEETIAANKEQFVDDKIPTEALSMGIGTIMDSKSLLMLATGKSKADMIKYLLNHHDDPSCPASFLKHHPHFTLVLDPDAASKINLKI
ncbi:glucosamine-6-phosphate deaminase [Peredibacter starrii]|uniref:Glucosamine-6-phosphate deaminase n=1 Tax=Peredibacter starrii TaxID=28202 RepID=A0AAX4HR09_9BACT|nr:glucosamine-6-phosphate deaminase [Peredibacter starrii]WPU65779.1 glucosamine-6-phosphate deaminase [Peredibacter starrii]